MLVGSKVIDMPQEEFLYIDGIVNKIHDELKAIDSCRWRIGALWNRAISNGWEEQGINLLDNTNVRYNSIVDYARVWRLSLYRHPHLSWSHHRAVCTLTKEEQKAWLDTAYLEGINAKTLSSLIHNPDPKPLKYVLDLRQDVHDRLLRHVGSGSVSDFIDELLDKHEGVL